MGWTNTLTMEVEVGYEDDDDDEEEEEEEEEDDDCG
jgi:hypothetical protein